MVENKVALITGGATGIGKAIALELARQGVNIVINYSRSEEDALQTREEIISLGVSCAIQRADVASDQEVKQMVDNTIDHFGRLDYLVNSAGQTFYVDMQDLDGLEEEHWDQIMAVNVKGLFFTCRAAAPYLKETRGSIVNITSVAGVTGIGSSIAYSASKAAAINVTKSLARVLAPEIRVNSVAPGVVISRWVEGKEEHVAKGKEGTLLEKVCTPKDVADLVVPLLISVEMITGQNIVVDGGKVL